MVDPELLPLLDAWPVADFRTDSLEKIRGRDIPIPPSEDQTIDIEAVEIAGAAGARPVTLYIYRPEQQLASGSLFHVHGGGFVTKRVRDFDAIHRETVAALGCTLISVEYRLAPETVHPGQIEDCYAGLVWMFENASRLRIDPARIGLVGESAGGALAAGLALFARDRGAPAPAFQCLSYPALDDRTGTVGDHHHPAREFVWPRHNNRFAWRAFLGHEPGGADTSPYAAPARAENLAGLPPTFLMTGALDLFADEGVAYARRLMQAGVACELHVYPGAFHGFDLSKDARVAQQARRDRVDFLRRMIS
jgi:triacylglycerol lipase